MTNEEFIKDLPTEPHGIQGTAISLVLSPEVPGFDGTTYEIAEKLKRDQMRLFEMLIAEKGGAVTLSAESNAGVGKNGVYVEPEKPKPDPVTDAQKILDGSPEPFPSG